MGLGLLLPLRDVTVHMSKCFYSLVGFGAELRRSPCWSLLLICVRSGRLASAIPLKLFRIQSCKSLYLLLD